MTYRRRWGTPVWHWSPECSQWPKNGLDGEERETPPPYGECCNECRVREPAGAPDER